ncbi:MAG: hypothetical protein ACP5UM_08820 [Anaerolineae bacterium]
MPERAGIFRRVREEATAAPQEAAVPGHEYVFGIDWARTSDWTVVTVLDMTTKELVYLDRWRDVDYRTQLMRLRALYQRFRPRAIIAEANSMGLPLIEQL